ncbi:hypothetical protein C0Q70_07287 [Pomacea canaliculata]|uniref:Uncharacterized protein n=1 Tax=Pomacea canaliculata TaxID=400727 RepID=A0A2T7PEM7_POMCA|nr:hypothetical protein C0Q70_07287 [Pomacea canaliculata]
MRQEISGVGSRGTRCASTVCTTSVHVLCFLLLNSLLDVIEINGCVSISVSATYLLCVCVVPGVNILLRKAALNITSYEEISVEEDNQEQWHIKHTSTFRSRESHPVVGQEFEETTMDGRRVKVGSTRMCTSVIRSHRYRRRVVLSVLTIEGNKLVYRQKAMTEGEIDTTVTREVLSDGRLLTCTVQRVQIFAGITSLDSGINDRVTY